MDVLLFLVLFFGVPAAVVAAVASAVARWRGNRRGLDSTDVWKRVKRTFWVAFVIVVGLEILAFGLCIAALNNSFG